MELGYGSLQRRRYPLNCAPVVLQSSGAGGRTYVAGSTCAKQWNLGELVTSWRPSPTRAATNTCTFVRGHFHLNKALNGESKQMYLGVFTTAETKWNPQWRLSGLGVISPHDADMNHCPSWWWRPIGPSAC